MVTPEIEAEALALWQKYCASAGSEGGEGALAVFCKIAPEDITENLQHNVELPSPPPAADQVS